MQEGTERWKEESKLVEEPSTGRTTGNMAFYDSHVTELDCPCLAFMTLNLATEDGPAALIPHPEWWSPEDSTMRASSIYYVHCGTGQMALPHVIGTSQSLQPELNIPSTSERRWHLGPTIAVSCPGSALWVPSPNLRSPGETPFASEISRREQREIQRQKTNQNHKASKIFIVLGNKAHRSRPRSMC